MAENQESMNYLKPVHTSELYMDTMWYCMPVRLGLFITTCFTFLFSFWCVCDRSGFEEYFRYFIGGYTFRSRVAIAAVEFSGVIFSLVGIVGLWKNKRSYLVTYNLWQFLRLAGWMYMYAEDVPLLGQCEHWVNSVDEMNQKYHWNQILFDVAMAGDCDTERRRFWVLSVLAVLVFMYISWCTFRYQDQMDRIPKHLLRLNKDPISGAFYSHSLGERTSLQGLRGNDAYSGASGLPMGPHMMMGPPMGTMGPVV